MTTQSGLNAKKIFTRFMFSLIITTSASAAHAQYDSKADSMQEHYIIKHVGSEDQMQVFTMQLDLSEGDKYMVEINENGANTLFKQLFQNQKITKTFKVPKDIESINFVIRNVKNNTVQTYAVNSIVKVYDDVVVRKIN